MTEDERQATDEPEEVLFRVKYKRDVIDLTQYIFRCFFLIIEDDSLMKETLKGSFFFYQSDQMASSVPLTQTILCETLSCVLFQNIVKAPLNGGII